MKGPKGGKKGNPDSMSVKDPMSKEEKSVTHWLRRNLTTKQTKFLHSHVVQYFSGAKAVDALVNDSPWSSAQAKEDQSLIFASRDQAVDYLDNLLKHKMFHRAKKIAVLDKKSKKDKKDSKEDGGGNNKDNDNSSAPNSPKPADDGGAKKKRKIRLDMHLDQIFLDSNDAYVWLYDPIPWYYWLGGSVIVLGIIAVCLFPLWPPIMRKGVHYLSISAAGFLILILCLALLKYIIFGLLFVLTGGKLKLWIFPNLTEDVGFFESFLPVYDYTYTGDTKKKAKDSDDEESDDEEDEDGEKKDGDSGSEDSSSKKSSTGKDFEMVNKDTTDVDE